MYDNWDSDHITIVWKQKVQSHAATVEATAAAKANINNISTV